MGNSRTLFYFKKKNISEEATVGVGTVGTAGSTGSAFEVGGSASNETATSKKSTLPINKRKKQEDLEESKKGKTKKTKYKLVPTT